jgi:hypothetical protein
MKVMKYFVILFAILLAFGTMRSVTLGQSTSLQADKHWQIDASSFTKNDYYKYYAVLYDRDQSPIGYFVVVYKWMGTIDAKYLSFVVEPESQRLADGRELVNGALGLRFSVKAGSLQIDLDDASLPPELRNRVGYVSVLKGLPEEGLDFSDLRLFDVVSPKPSVQPAVKQVVAVAVAPAQIVMAKGKSVRIKVTARYSDRSLVDVTNLTSWSVSKAGVVAVKAGQVYALKSGVCNLVARYAGKATQVRVVVR